MSCVAAVWVSLPVGCTAALGFSAAAGTRYREKDREAKRPCPLAEQGAGITRRGRSPAGDLLCHQKSTEGSGKEVHASICSSKQGVKQAGFVMGNFEEAGNTLEHERVLKGSYCCAC